uniref:Uncharacterized protein n=1 Tax=Grammatophora oceanica TaxID=210454 RepID=A0A7S1V7F7_9STRA
MKLVATFLAASLVGLVDSAFIPGSLQILRPNRGTRSTLLKALSPQTELDECGCDTAPADETFVSKPLARSTKSGEALRSAVFTDVNGGRVRLGDRMVSGSNVVIFLRHLG